MMSKLTEAALQQTEADEVSILLPMLIPKIAQRPLEDRKKLVVWWALKWRLTGKTAKESGSV